MSNILNAFFELLQVAVGNREELTLCPNEEEGRFLLREIMMAGNFGRYDKRMKHSGGQVVHAWEKLKHNFRLVGHYPEEVLMEPWFRWYHWFWRTFRFWRWSFMP